MFVHILIFNREDGLVSSQPLLPRIADPRSLDEPLHLHILTSLASSYAAHPSNSDEQPIHALTRGLPQTALSTPAGQGLPGSDEEDDEWVCSSH